MPRRRPLDDEDLLDEIAVDILDEIDAILEQPTDETVIVTRSGVRVTSNQSPADKHAEGWLTRIVDVETLQVPERRRALGS